MKTKHSAEEHITQYNCNCTRYAFALESLGNDGEWLVAWLTQHLTQLLHTVAVHDHRLPAEKSQQRDWFMDQSEVLTLSPDDTHIIV